MKRGFTIIIGVPITIAAILASSALTGIDLNTIAVVGWGSIAVILLSIAGVLAIRQAKGETDHA